MWDQCGKLFDLEEPTPLPNQVYQGCTQGEADVGHHAVQAKADLFRRIATTEVTKEKEDKEDEIPFIRLRGVTCEDTPKCRKVLRTFWKATMSAH